MAGELFPYTSTGDIRPKKSAGQNRTERQRRDLANRIHPATGRWVILVGATCGTCAHHFVHRMGKRYHKCEYTATRGPASDIRVGWPACTLWEAGDG